MCVCVCVCVQVYIRVCGFVCVCVCVCRALFCMQLLLENDANAVLADEDGNTGLHLAAFEGVCV